MINGRFQGSVTKSGEFKSLFSEKRQEERIQFSGFIDDLDSLKKNLSVSKYATKKETLMAAYLKWGVELPEKIKGHYLIIIWNEKKKKLFAVASPFFNGCLFYTEEKGVFKFSDAMNDIKNISSHSPQVDTDKICSALMLSYPNPEKTYYKGIFKLNPGHFLIFERGRSVVRRFWDAEKINNNLSYKTEGEYFEHFREIFTKSVEKFLPEHGRPGGQLSGGLDSSSVCSIAAHILKKRGGRLKVYGNIPPDDFVFPGHKNWSQSDKTLMEDVARFNGNIDLNFCILDEKDRYSDLAQTLYEVGEGPVRNPFNYIWIIKTLQMAKFDGMSSLLTGTFGNVSISHNGYPTQFFEVFVRMLKSLKSQLRYKTYSYNKFSLINPKKIPIRHWLKKPLFRFREYSISDEVNGCFSFFGEVASTQSALKNHFGVELLDPTADQELVEFCLKVPNSIFYQDGLKRGLVRRGMVGHVSDSVLQNQKRGEQGANWFYLLKSDLHNFKKLLPQFEKSDLVNECLDMRALVELMQSFEQTSPVGNYRNDLEYPFQLKLLRGLHVAQWLLLHERD